MPITKGVSVLTHNGEDMAINDANIAHEFDQASAYAIGDHVTYCGKLYCFHAPHAANAAWDYTKVREILIGDEVTAVKNNLTVPFDETVSYSAGWYTYYQPDQALYRFTVDHAAGPWSYSHVVRVTVGDEIIRNRTETDSAITDLKSAIGEVPTGKTVQSQIEGIHDTIGAESLPAGITVESQIQTLNSKIGGVPSGTSAQLQINDIKSQIQGINGNIENLQDRDLEHDVKLSILSPAATAEDVGKTLIVKSVSGGAVSEYVLLAIESGLSHEAKIALLTCLSHVVFTDEQGAVAYEALRNTLMPRTYPIINVEYNPDGHVVHAGDALESLRPYISVIYYETAESGGETIISYTLNGTITAGDNIITVTYNGLAKVIEVHAVGWRIAQMSDLQAIGGYVEPNIDENGNFTRASCPTFSLLVFNDSIRKIRFKPMERIHYYVFAKGTGNSFYTSDYAPPTTEKQFEFSFDQERGVYVATEIQKIGVYSPYNSYAANITVEVEIDSNGNMLVTDITNNRSILRMTNASVIGWGEASYMQPYTTPQNIMVYIN